MGASHKHTDNLSAIVIGCHCTCSCYALVTISLIHIYILTYIHMQVSSHGVMYTIKSPLQLLSSSAHCVVVVYAFQEHTFTAAATASSCVMQVWYDDELKRVVCEPLEMTQEFRRFDLQSPWELFPKHRDPTVIPPTAKQIYEMAE